MKKQAFLLWAAVCVVLGCTLAAGCTAPDNGPDDGPASVTEVPEYTDAVASANTLFAYDLYHRLSTGEQNSGENIFFSPYSISTALALTYEGAKGTTADEIQSVFYFPVNNTVRQEGYAGLIGSLNSPDAAYSLSTANALWAEETYPFLSAYTGTAERYYGAEVRNMDFINAPEASRQTINQWVEDQTEDRIKDLIPAGVIDPLTRLVITNAVYFKGTWVLQFDEEDTQEASFLTGSGNYVTVDMMQRTDEDARYNYTETDDLQILRMPYEHERGKALSMLVILPKSDDITPAETALGTSALADAVASMKSEQVRVYFPKFTLETTYSLPETLGAMGMPTAFGPGADFSGMDGTRDLFISDVIHKAFVDVNEEGTEAAAATAVVMRLTAVEADPVPVFRADHPFIFLITDDETGTILFMGRMSDPSA